MPAAIRPSRRGLGAEAMMTMQVRTAARRGGRPRAADSGLTAALRRRAPSWRRTLLDAVRHHPVTAAVLAATSAVSIPGMFVPALVRALEQNPTLTFHGQWWRLATPLLAQGYGLPQYLFNMAGILAVGPVVERRYGGPRWLAQYLGAGIAGIGATSRWFPHWIDSGSSTGVAGLIGALVVDTTRRGRKAPAAAMLYAIVYCALLAAMPLGEARALLASAAAAAGFAASRRGPAPRRLPALGVPFVAASTAVMLSARDIHGVGLAAGMLLAALIGPRAPHGAAPSRPA